MLDEDKKGFVLDLNKKLMDDFGDTITNLSKTDNNKFIENSFKMINLDKMSTEFPKTNKIFKGYYFSTADALYISKVNNELILWFFEFKKLDFKTDDKIYVTRLKNCFEEMRKCFKEMNACEHDCFIKDEECFNKKFEELSKQFNFEEQSKHKFEENSKQFKFKDLLEELKDKSKVSLIKKPYESLVLLYYFFDCYENVKGELDRNDLFNVTKFYTLVSMTETEYDPECHGWGSPNKSNNRLYVQNVKSSFHHLVGLHKYHYNYGYAVNYKTFEAFLNQINSKQKSLSMF